MTSSRIKHYTKRNEWHKRNIPIVSSFFQNKCQRCNRLTNQEEGAIHHLKYTGHDYERELNDLLHKEAIIWVCKKCHQFEHIAYTSSEVDYKIKHSGYCAVCNKFSWYAWYKLGFGRLAGHPPSEAPFCDKCINLLSKENVLILLKIKGRQFIQTQPRELRTEKGIMYSDHIKARIEIDVWGDKKIKDNWQNSNKNDQLNLPI